MPFTSTGVSDLSLKEFPRLNHTVYIYITIVYKDSSSSSSSEILQSKRYGHIKSEIVSLEKLSVKVKVSYKTQVKVSYNADYMTWKNNPSSLYSRFSLMRHQ